MESEHEVKQRGRLESAWRVTGSAGPVVVEGLGAAIGAVVTVASQLALGVGEPESQVLGLALAAVIGAIAGAMMTYPVWFIINLVRGRRIAAEDALYAANERVRALAVENEHFQERLAPRLKIGAPDKAVAKGEHGEPIDYIHFVVENPSDSEVRGCRAYIKSITRQVEDRTEETADVGTPIDLPVSRYI